LHDHLCKTITADNGIENKHHREIAQQLKIKFYFCHPYHSWEKGTNENTNGMLRRYLPRQVSLDTVTDDELADIEYELNNRPRKILGFKTPYEVLQSHYQFVALAI
jgi:IS30 family transposase